MASLLNGLFSARSGLSSHGVALSVVGDNISNASTTAYKTSRAEFEDVIAGGQTTGKVVGSGGTCSAVTNIFEQGTFEVTGRDLDLAIDGNGFFIVKEGGRQLYTRAGNFKLDGEGFIVDQRGNRVQGFPANGSGTLEDLDVTSITQQNVATKNVSIVGNLDARDVAIKGGAAKIPQTIEDGGTATYADLSEMAAFQTVVDVFDGLGTSHTVTAYFFKTVDGTSKLNSEYQVRLYIDANEVEGGGDDGQPYCIGQATLTFDGNGNRTNVPTLPDKDIASTVQWSKGAGKTTIEYSFADFTMYSTNAGVSSITGDGNGVGQISGLNIDSTGEIYALLDNGQSSIIGTIGMANFANSEGLERIGSNYLEETIDSGSPIIGTSGSGKLGKIESGSLELSTVDIASEFVKLITLQRNFQANSRIVTTVNQLLNEIISMA